MDSRSDGRGGRDGPTIDQVSPRNLKRLLAAGSPKAKRGQVEVITKKLTVDEINEAMVDWNPRAFRDFVAHKPEDYK